MAGESVKFMYNIGDKVKCIKDYFHKYTGIHQFKSGKIYEVFGYRDHENHPRWNSVLSEYEHEFVVNHVDFIGTFILYNIVEIKEEKDYYTWLANR